MNKYSNHIYEARQARKITQVKMAKLLNIARQTYIDMESGKTIPRADMLERISEITEFPIGFFFELHTPKFKENIIDTYPPNIANELEGVLKNLILIIKDNPMESRENVQ